MQGIYPCLWFDQEAQEAAEFYVSVFRNSRMLGVSHYTEGMPMPAGTVLTATFELNGQKIMALNGGPIFKFSEAISIVVTCDTQAEIDELYAKLSVVPEAEQCGWLKDKYGVSWQLFPSAMEKILAQGDTAKTSRVFQALMPMKRLDLAALLQAAEG